MWRVWMFNQNNTVRLLMLQTNLGHSKPHASNILLRFFDGWLNWEGLISVLIPVWCHLILRCCSVSILRAYFICSITSRIIRTHTLFLIPLSQMLTWLTVRVNTVVLAYMEMLRRRCRQYSRFLNQVPETCLSHVAIDSQIKSMLNVILVVIVSPTDQDRVCYIYQWSPYLLENCKTT